MEKEARRNGSNEMNSPSPEPQGVREALEQIIANCDDNSTPTCRHDLALKFVRSIAIAALAQSDAQPPDCPTEGVAARQGNGA
jgi:hypothetical protein